jgi:hypothetical protein
VSDPPPPYPVLLFLRSYLPALAVKVLPVGKYTTPTRCINCAVSSLSMSLVFSESLIRGIALIRFLISSLVAPNSAEDNSFGLVSTVWPELSPPLESDDFCELGFWC